MYIHIMSGFYNNWLKVQNPDSTNDIVQMESGGFQAPFYFGGSQVPSALGLQDTNVNITGNGLNNSSKMNFKPIKKGKGVQCSNFHKHTNIHLPRYMKNLDN